MIFQITFYIFLKLMIGSFHESRKFQKNFLYDDMAGLRSHYCRKILGFVQELFSHALPPKVI